MARKITLTFTVKINSKSDLDQRTCTCICIIPSCNLTLLALNVHCKILVVIMILDQHAILSLQPRPFSCTNFFSVEKIYCISGNFRYLKIFAMEKFDSGNFRKFFYVHKFACTKITCRKMQEWTKVPYFLEYMPRHYRYFFLNALEPVLKQGVLLIIVLQRVLKLLIYHAKIT